MRIRSAVDRVDGLAEVVGDGVGGGDCVRACLDLDGPVTAGCLDELAMDQPVWCSIRRLTARAAVTCSSIPRSVRRARSALYW